ncbi:MAG: TrkA C-terminal domain-containing protein [Bacteroidota bacterium]
MIGILAENPLLLLFVVAAIGYGLGSITIRGNKLGVAAVLFVGLFFGALDDKLQIPNIIFLLGLAIFVYSIGLSSGPGFMAAFQGKRQKELGFTFLMTILSGVVALGMFYLFELTPGTTGGMFAGSSTNTAALAGLLDAIQKNDSLIDPTSLTESAVVGYSITYPMGVLGGMIAIIFMQKMLKINYAEEAQALKHEYPIDSSIANATIEVQSADFEHTSIRDLLATYRWTATFGRVFRDGETFLSNMDLSFKVGDLVAVAGRANDIEEIAETLGRFSKRELTREPSDIEIHRVFVSNPEVAGQKIAALNLNEKYATIITRVRRGDVDLLARGDTVIELGDRIRFVSRRKDVSPLIKVFGDSYQSLSQIDLVSFGLGMAMGLLLGMVTFTIPGGISFQLGFAGGPLLVALVLGAVRRTGSIVWTLPYGANLTLRQFGLILLLAAVGTRSGHTFVETIQGGGGGAIFLAGCVVSLATAFGTLFLGYKLFKIPFSILTGMVANQPAILDFALNRTGNLLPTFGYAVMFPIALIMKIVIVQVLFALLI